MESKEFLEKYNQLDKPTKIGLVLAELPQKIQIEIIRSVLEDNSLNDKERYNISCYLLYKSTLSQFDKKHIYNYRDRLLKCKEHCVYDEELEEYISKFSYWCSVAGCYVDKEDCLMRDCEKCSYYLDS